MKKDDLYAEIFQRGIKEKKSTNLKSLKNRLNVAMQNRLRNVKMSESNLTALVNFLETAISRLLRMIYEAMVVPQNEFIGARAPTVPDSSEV